MQFASHQHVIIHVKTAPTCLRTPTIICWLHIGRLHTHFVASCYETNIAAHTARLQRKMTVRNEAPFAMDTVW